MPTYLLYINSWLFRFGRLANDVTITVISQMPRRHKKRKEILKKAKIMYLFHSNFRNLCQKWLLKINIAKPNFRTLFIYQKCSQFDGRYSYIQRYLRAKLGAYRTVCGISGVHNGEAAEFPIHTSLIHGSVLARVANLVDAIIEIGIEKEKAVSISVWQLPYVCD